MYFDLLSKGEVGELSKHFEDNQLAQDVMTWLGTEDAKRIAAEDHEFYPSNHSVEMGSSTPEMPVFCVLDDTMQYVGDLRLVPNYSGPGYILEFYQPGAELFTSTIEVDLDKDISLLVQTMHGAFQVTIGHIVDIQEQEDALPNLKIELRYPQEATLIEMVDVEFV